MKRLSFNQIDDKKLLKKEELLSLKGGDQPIDQGYLTCRVNGVICWSASILDCSYAQQACNAVCGSWTEAICVGPLL